MSGFGSVVTYGRADAGGLLSSQPVIAFAATTQPDRARAFYAFVLGLGLIEDTPHALVFDAGGTMLHVQKVRAFAPAPFTVLGWHVADIAAAIRGLAARGIGCELAHGVLPDDDGIWTGPSGARMIWFRDPDGNLLSLMQLPPR
jgi:catechol 2,3-dioxygenase-like lactoylglutathione lyase family enzyme